MNMNTFVNVNSYVAMNDSVNYVEKCNKCLELEVELIKQHNMVDKDEYNRLLNSFSKLEQHCISLELAMQLNKENFQNNSTSVNQIEPTFDHVFELNNLKAELQAKDITIDNLKANIKPYWAKLLSGKERLHIELEHLKKIYKDQFDSIKKTRILSKEHGDSLIAQLNSKSMKNEDLKHQLQDKVFVITSLKNDLRKLKGKETVEKAAQIPIAITVAPVMFKLDLDPLSPRLLQNREAHIYYLKHTQEQADILRGIVEQTKSKQPLDNALDLACKQAKRIQELLVYVRDTCPNAIKLSEKKVDITPLNKVKKVRFSEPLTSSSNTKQVESSKTSDSNTPMLSSTRLKCSSSTCRSQLTGNKRNDRISQKRSSNRKNKVEAQPRKVNKNNRVKEPICDDNVKHTMLNANSQLIFVKCKQCMFDANHDVCFLDFVNDVNMHAKSKSKTFTLVGNVCPLTRIASTNEVPFREPIHPEVVAQEPVAAKVFTKRPKVVQIVLWYMDSGCSKHMTKDRSQLTNFVHKFLDTVKFNNDQIAKIMGYGDYQIVAFRKHTCFVRNLEGDDLLSG
ncbi:hypothetical protein Tco_1089593 [Tanacetum coccineum]